MGLSPSDSAPEPTSPLGKLLLIDDDNVFRPALQKTLEALGYCVVATDNAKHGLELFLNDSFDAIVSDIQMPEMDGIELTRYIRSSSRAVPIVLVTGFSDVIETKEAYELGATEFLTKPINRAELQQALQRCIGKASAIEPVAGEEPLDQDTAFCKLAIEDFTSGRQIQFNIFMQLSPDKFVKIAHSGEDLSHDKVNSYQSKGIEYLYIRKRDFRTYVGHQVDRLKEEATQAIPFERKAVIIKKTGEILYEFSRHQGLNLETYKVSSAFVQATVEILSDEPDVFRLLEILNQHTDHLYRHSLGVSLYSVMLAKEVGWGLPTNKFKLAMGGLLHDIGEKEVPRELLMRPRWTWNAAEVKQYESHPYRSMEILGMIRSIPSDVLHIAKEHHESCLADGFPARMTRNTLHPMAKLVMVADEFCGRVLKGPNGLGLSPKEAIDQMKLTSADRMDAQFFQALQRLFAPPGSLKRDSSRRKGPFAQKT